MSPLEIAIFLMVAIVAGMLIALSIDAVLLGVYVKVPGRDCARDWASGSALILFASIAFLRLGEAGDLLVASLAVAAFLLGHVLQWRGLQIFYFKPVNALVWPAAGVFMVGYVALHALGAGFVVRMAFISVVPMVVWSACLREVLRSDAGRGQFSSQLAAFGLGLMLLSSAFDIVIAFLPALREALHLQPLATILMTMVAPILGAILYLSALVLMYFDRVAEHTNYAATHDELTGLLNRRAIIAAGRRELEFTRRVQQPMVIAFLDIDHFKRINDTWGHDMGDLVLREAARVLQDCCRSVDLVGRYGGEEFCMIFPGDHHGGAQVVGERLVRAFRHHEFAGYGQAVTVSVGLVPVDPHNEQLDWDKLLQLADIELYKAKQNGRDNFSVFGQESRRPRFSGPAENGAAPVARSYFGVFRF